MPGLHKYARGRAIPRTAWASIAAILAVVVAAVIAIGALPHSLAELGDSGPPGAQPAGTGVAATPEPAPGESQQIGDDPGDPDEVLRSDDGPTRVITDDESLPSAALELLATIEVKGRAPKTGYDREGMFGPAWPDVDGNGCDTRNDILARDLIDIRKDGHCLVVSGTLEDRYTGTRIPFQRGRDTSAAVQIDHVVALMDAWQSGAQQLTQAERVSFANDPLNLMATDGPTNQQKGASNAASWLPPDRSFWCEYVARQVSVKAHYGLWVTEAERDTMQRILGGCGTLAVPTDPFVAADPGGDAVGSSGLVAPVPAGAGEGTYYANCAAVRAAGAAPIKVGDAGYASHLDRDLDGIGCED